MAEPAADRPPGAPAAAGQRLAGAAQAALVGALWAAAARLDPDRASALGAALFARIGPRTKKHRMVIANLRVVAPGLAPAAIERLARASWAQFGRVVGEYPHLGRLACEPGRVELVDRFGLARAAAGRPAILVAAHLANWELPAAVAARAGVPMTVVHAPHGNPLVGRRLLQLRAALGCRFLPSDASAHAMVAELRAGRSIGVLLDQRYDRGDAVAFFGRPAPVAIAPALLAARLGVPFVPARVERIEGARFRLTVEPPLEPALGLGAPRAVARDLAQRLYARFEAWIAERPDEWLCIKRRWPDPRKAKWRRKLERNPRLLGERAGALDEGRVGS